jgi:DICT domain-containing protein
MTDEIKRRRWYMQEAERIITEADEDCLVEILKVRDAACALYAKETMQLNDEFKDSDVLTWLDSKRVSPAMAEYGHGFMRDENV